MTRPGSLDFGHPSPIQQKIRSSWNGNGTIQKGQPPHYTSCSTIKRISAWLKDQFWCYYLLAMFGLLFELANCAIPEVLQTTSTTYLVVAKWCSLKFYLSEVSLSVPAADRVPHLPPYSLVNHCNLQSLQLVGDFSFPGSINLSIPPH